MTVRHLLASIDSREISEWIAYFNLQKKPASDELANTERIKAFFKRKGKKK